MGASNYKKQREAEHKDGLNARELAERETAAKKKKARTKYIVIAIVIVVLAAAALFINSPLFFDSFPALTVNDTDYTVADVNYYYQTGYMTFVNSYSSYISLFLDPDQPLDEQKCTISTEDITWAEYFRNTAEDNLTQITAYYDAAVAAGYTLTEEDKAELENIKADYEYQAAMMGYELDAYLVMYFGEGNNWENVSDNISREYLANRFLKDQYDSYTYTDEELDAYYAEHVNDFDNVEYIYAYISGAADEEAGLDAEAASAKAAEDAQAVLDIWNNGDQAAFEAAVREVTGVEAVAAAGSNSTFVSQFADAVTLEELEVGKAFATEISGSWHVVYITDMYDCLYPTVDVRHILIKAVDEDADGVYSDAEKQAAYDRVVEIQEEWLAGTADEESFMALANLYSEDAGSNTNGGLYEQVYKGRMVQEFNDFCFGDRKTGDYDIVYGETTGYAGYHLMYFVGENEQYSHLLADASLRSEAYDAYCAELAAPYEATRGAMWRFVLG